NTYSSNGAKTHTYADGPNNYNITVDLVDEDGTFSDTANPKTITVDNVAPTADLTNDGPVSADDRRAGTDSNNLDPSSADTTSRLHYAYSCSNGDLSASTYDGSSSNDSTTCSYDDGPSDHTVKARIIDKDGGFSEYTTSVHVRNVAPTADLTNDGPV